MVTEHEFPYPHKYYDEKTGKVICQMCGKPFVTISPKHLIKHSINYNEYKLRFPDAPLSSEEFAIRSVHGKNKDMFRNSSEDPAIEEIKIEEITDAPDKTQEENPLVEELEIIKLKDKIVKLDKVQATKKNILTQLSLTFSNVKQDYFIEEKMISGHLKYRYITDFADPVLRIAFFFPDTFWHNNDGYYDRLRDSKLEADGWKVVTVKKVNPTLQDIEKTIKDVF